MRSAISNPLATKTPARAVEHFTTLEDRNIHQDQTADGWTATSEETISGETVTNLIQHCKIGDEDFKQIMVCEARPASP